MKDFQCATKEFKFKRDLFKVSDKESSITLSMYLGVKWEDSRIRNMNQTVEDLQVMVRVFQNAKSQNFKVGVSQNWLLYQTKSLQKELGFFLQNCGTAQFFRF